MAIQDQAGNALLATSSSTAMVGWLAQVDTIVSIVVSILGGIGIVYSIIWHRCRIRQLRKKNNE